MDPVDEIRSELAATRSDLVAARAEVRRLNALLAQERATNAGLVRIIEYAQETLRGWAHRPVPDN